MAERVVVGVDGSAHMPAVLDAAIDEARLRGMPLHVVVAYHAPIAAGFSFMATHRLPEEDVRHAAAEVIEAAMEHVGDAVTATSEVVQGHAGPVLVDLAVDDPVLVLGTRGHGGLSGVILGSTAQYVVSHRRAPVLVVPDQLDQDY